MLPDRVSNPGPLTYESGALPIALRGPALLTLVIETETKIVWPHFKVIWFSKDNPTGHSVRTKKKRQTEEEVGRQYQRVDRNGLCQLN